MTLGKSRDVPRGADLRVVSWNLLRRIGACVEDIARLVRSHHPDLLFLQEATEEVTALPSLVGGHFFRHPMDRRIYGLAAWSPHPFPPTVALRCCPAGYRRATPSWCIFAASASPMCICRMASFSIAGSCCMLPAPWKA